MGNEIYTSIKGKLKAKPKKLTDLDQWLFVVVNTAKSIIDNTSKNNLGDVMKLSECKSTSQIQHEFDIIQGKFGREGFLKGTVLFTFIFAHWWLISQSRAVKQG